LFGKSDWSLEAQFDNPSQTYTFGQQISIGIKFRNLSKTSILLTRVVVRFDWQADNECYQVYRNAVYTSSIEAPFLWSFELPQFQMNCIIPPDVKHGHHAFKFGVEYSLWVDHEWKQVEGIQWVKNTKPVSDRILVEYPQAREFHVFVSHSETDKELTQKVDDSIRKIGQQPYIAESPLNPEIGKKLFEEKINGAIQRAGVMVLLWTNKSSMSQAVRYEINYGRQLNKRILVALEAGMSPPPELEGLVYVRLDYGNETEALKLITKSLLQYEAEFQEGQRNGQAIATIIGLLALSYFTK
jgi:hypothetical protein